MKTKLRVHFTHRLDEESLDQALAMIEKGVRRIRRLIAERPLRPKELALVKRHLKPIP